MTLKDGTSFGVDLDADLASTGSPPATLGEVVEAIQAAADAADSTTGTAAAVAASNQLIDASSPFGPANSVVGRQVVVGDEVRTIVANTADALTLNADWQTPPAAGPATRF